MKKLFVVVVEFVYHLAIAVIWWGATFTLVFYGGLLMANSHDDAVAGLYIILVPSLIYAILRVLVSVTPSVTPLGLREFTDHTLKVVGSTIPMVMCYFVYLIYKVLYPHSWILILAICISGIYWILCMCSYSCIHDFFLNVVERISGLSSKDDPMKESWYSDNDDELWDI